MDHGDARQAWIAFYSIHYQGEWYRYHLTDPRRLDRDFQPWLPRDAVDFLASYQGDQASWLRRVAIAALVRGSDSPTVQDIHNLVAPLALAEQLTRAQIAALERGDTHQSAGDRFFRALNAIEPKKCRIDNLTLNAKFCRPALLSDVELRVTVRRPSQALASQVDPRLWRVNFPMIWTRSDTVGPLVPFADRDIDPPSIALPGSSWSSMFFERLTWVAPGSAQNFQLSDIRNVLGVSYQESPPGPLQSAKVTYRNVECLSTSFPLVGSTDIQGGIDHDSGFGSVAPLPTDNSKTLIIGKKSVRFTEPKSAVVLMNESTFISTIALLEYMVLSGACA